MKDFFLSRLPFYRWHPEVAIRYLPIVSEILKNDYQTILEVGSGGLGITPYLGREVTGLDRHFDPPIHPLVKTKIGSALKIPFEDKSFDVVISVDMLEHLPSTQRKKAIAEILRVTKKEIILAVPTGQESLNQDQELAAFYKKINRNNYPFLTEHKSFGLPSKEEIKSQLGDNVIMEQNEPLRLRSFLMRGWMTKNFITKLFYWKILLLAIPLFKLFDKKPYYRTIFYKAL